MNIQLGCRNEKSYESNVDKQNPSRKYYHLQRVQIRRPPSFRVEECVICRYCGRDVILDVISKHEVIIAGTTGRWF